MGGLAADASRCVRLILPILPAVIAPIAAPWMFAEGDAGTGPPVIVVNDHTRTRRIIVPLVNVPANIAATDNGCRRSHHRRGQNSRSCRRTEKDFSQTHICVSLLRSSDNGPVRPLFLRNTRPVRTTSQIKSQQRWNARRGSGPAGPA